MALERLAITKNEVTLFGMVESEAVRSKAVELTKTAHVGIIIKDKMTVKQGRPSAHAPDHY